MNIWRKIKCVLGFHCVTEHTKVYIYGKFFDQCMYCGRLLEIKNTDPYLSNLVKTKTDVF